MQLFYCLCWEGIRQTVARVEDGSPMAPFLRLCRRARIRKTGCSRPVEIVREVKMKAAVVNELGQAPRYQDFPEPVVQEGEALIDIRAAGLHPVVKALASGSHYAGKGEVPAVPGIDGVGRLEDGSRV